MQKSQVLLICVEELILAFENDCDYLQYYLDSETGEIFCQSEDCLNDFDLEIEESNPQRFRRILPIGANDINVIIRACIESLVDDELKNKIILLLKDSHPLKIYKEITEHDIKLKKKWVPLYQREMEKFAEQWLKKNKIPYEII
jgi:hypothetical protein